MRKKLDRVIFEEVNVIPLAKEGNVFISVVAKFTDAIVPDPECDCGHCFVRFCEYTLLVRLFAEDEMKQRHYIHGAERAFREDSHYDVRVFAGIARRFRQGSILNHRFPCQKRIVEMTRFVGETIEFLIEAAMGCNL